MYFQFNSFKNYLNPKLGKSWTSVAKMGLFFISLGCLVIILKEIIIFLISLVLFLIGFVCLFFAFKIWKLNNFYSNNIYS